MKLRLNHVAIIADDAKELATFYREVIGLEPVVTGNAQSVDPNSYKWLKLGDNELHMIQRNDELAKRLGVEINPLRNHFAIDVDSVEGITKITEKLTEAGIQWMDWSPHGIPGRHQVFMVDPAGNIVEFQLAEADV